MILPTIPLALSQTTATTSRDLLLKAYLKGVQLHPLVLKGLHLQFILPLPMGPGQNLNMLPIIEYRQTEKRPMKQVPRPQANPPFLPKELIYQITGYLKPAE